MEIYLADLNYQNSKWNLDIQEYLEGFSEIIWTKRWQQTGDFVLKIPTSQLKSVTNYDDLINKFLCLKSPLTSNNSIVPDEYMIIEKIVLDYDLDNNEILTLEGKDLLTLLERRIIWGMQSFDASETIKHAIDTMVTDAIVNPADANRKINGFEIGTYTASDTFEAEQRSYNNVFESIIELCGTEYSPRIDLTDKFTFVLYQGTDRTVGSASPLVFSNRLDNLEQFEWLKDVSEYKNAWLVGGEGEGTDRKTQSKFRNTGETDDRGVGLYRREIFIDAKDISSEVDGATIPEATYNQMLLQRVDEKMLETWIKEACTSELTFEGVRYGVDYSIGDKATVIDTLGNAHNIRITEFIRSQNADGYKEYPNFEII